MAETTDRRAPFAIGAWTSKGSMYWTGSGFSKTWADAKTYKTARGARAACTREYRKSGRILNIVYDSLNGPYDKYEFWQNRG